MGYAPDSTLAMLRGAVNLGVFFRLGTTPAPILLSCSVGDMPLALPGLDAPGSVYLGAGRITSIPALYTLINRQADTVTFGLGGLDPAVLSYMLDTSPEVLGAPCTLGIAPLDAQWQPAAPVVRLWTGTADFLAQSMPPDADPTRSRTQTLTLTATTGDQSRQLGNNLTLTDATQQMLAPGDTACNRTSRYNQQYLCSWPRYN